MIREEYKRAFLDEKNARTIMIHIIDDDEYIGSDRIVDQASFNYTDVSNEGDEIKLGFDSTSSFEIDIKGDLVDKTGKEIYVELQAYNNSDSELKVYTIPVGHFIITKVDYDYKLDKSHILSYDKTITSEDKTMRIPTGTLIPTWVIDFMFDCVPDSYFVESEPIILEKHLAEDTFNIYSQEWVNTYNASDRSYTYYHTQTIKKCQYCVYTFSEEFRRNYYFFLILNSVHLTNIETEADVNILDYKQNFMANNPLYNMYSPEHRYDSHNSKTTTDYTGSASDVPVGFVYPDSSLDSKYNWNSYSAVKVTRTVEASFFHRTYNDWLSYQWLDFPSSTPDVRYTTDYAGIDAFIDFEVKGANIIPFRTYITESGISAYTINDWIRENGDLTERKAYSDFAEILGQNVGINRETGEFEAYGFAYTDLLLPSNDLYPSSDLYPRGNRKTIKITKNMYSELIAKTKQSKKVGKVIVPYPRIGKEYVAQVEDFDEYNYSTIKLSDNNFFVYCGFTKPQEVADAILNMYKDYTYTPFELECTGLPWLEAGDWISVETDDGNQILNVNRRSLKGIQGMMDSLSAGGI